MCSIDAQMSITGALAPRRARAGWRAHVLDYPHDSRYWIVLYQKNPCLFLRQFIVDFGTVRCLF